MAVELRFQLGDAGLQGRDLLLEDKVVGLELGAQGVHERAHGWGRRGPIERGDLRRRGYLMHGCSLAHHGCHVKSDALCYRDSGSSGSLNGYVQMYVSKGPVREVE